MWTWCLILIGLLFTVQKDKKHLSSLSSGSMFITFFILQHLTIQRRTICIVSVFPRWPAHGRTKINGLVTPRNKTKNKWCNDCNDWTNECNDWPLLFIKCWLLPHQPEHRHELRMFAFILLQTASSVHVRKRTYTLCGLLVTRVPGFSPLLWLKLLSLSVGTLPETVAYIVPPGGVIVQENWDWM